MDARSWALMLIGVVGGVVLAQSRPVRGALDMLAGWWWELVDTVRWILHWAGVALLVVLAGAGLWALLPRLVAER